MRATKFIAFPAWYLVCIVSRMLIPGMDTAMAATVARGREEGTLFSPASNVLGSGNITAFTSGGVWYSKGALRIDPVIGGSIGIGAILQASAQIQPIGKKGLGPLEAHAQLTLPKNDNLRLFGVALRGDLYLSTTIDTISATSDTSKPQFSPFFYPALLMDCDLISKFPSLPIKAYLTVGLVDLPTLLFQYNQICIKGGLEARLYKHAIFLDGGLGLYKEKATRLNNLTSDKRFHQGYVWLAPGARYRFLDRFSVVAALKFTVVQFVKSTAPLLPDLVGFGLRIEAPVYFRETNAEAIRTLIFMEKEKKTEENIALQKQTPEQYKLLNLDVTEVDNTGTTFNFGAENDKLIRERAAVANKMDTLEQILEDIDAP